MLSLCLPGLIWGVRYFWAPPVADSPWLASSTALVIDSESQKGWFLFNTEDVEDWKESSSKLSSYCRLVCLICFAWRGIRSLTDLFLAIETDFPIRRYFISWSVPTPLSFTHLKVKKKFLDTRHFLGLNDLLGHMWNIQPVINLQSAWYQLWLKYSCLLALIIVGH